MGIHQSDKKTTLTATVVDDNGDAVDISGATTMTFVLEKPDGTVTTKTASFLTDGTDGIVKYDTVTDDFDVSGLWHFQAYIDISTGDTVFHTDIEQFEVKTNLN